MPEASHESHFEELLAKGMAGAEEIAEARRLLADAAARGADLSVAEALLRAGVMAARARHVAAAPAPDAATAAAEDTAAAAMPSSDLQVLEKLGRGAQAVVFKCRQISMDRIVAAKILLAKSARDPDARERFIREARQAANLAHPNIVTIHQIMPFQSRSASGDETIDTFCIVMEYVDGGSVAELLAARKRFDPAEAACIIRPVAEALALAHRRGIIHRDIKPGNILLTAGGLVKLADLGLALPLTAAQQAAQPGRVHGTPYYISPEQVRGDADIDFRADLYSLAATFYEMVAGVPPFTAATPQEVMRKHLTEPPPDPRQHVPELSGALCWMLARALAKDRAYRYESAEDFIGALEKIFPTVDAGDAGASAADRRAALADDESAVAAPVVDLHVPAAQAMVEQLAGAAETERRRVGRVSVPARQGGPGRPAEKAAARSGAAARAGGASPRGRAAPDVARDPKRVRKRNLILVVAFGATALVAIVAAVLIPVLMPPPKAPESKTPATPIYARTSELPTAATPNLPPPAAVAPVPPAKVAAPVPPPAAPKPPEPPRAPPKEERPPELPKPPEPPPAPPKEEKPPEPPKLPAPPPAPPEVITLKAADAKPHGPKGGKGIRYEKVGSPGSGEYRDNIGFWSGKDEYVTWDVTIPQPGTYEVEITYSAPAGIGGEYTVEVAGKKLKAKTAETGGWEKFTPKALGTLKISKAGPATIAVRPVTLPKGGGLMNLQAVTLKRTGV
jgi:tRNA A-37 threonylcarbamoyl transferase component Bud32